VTVSTNLKAIKTYLKSQYFTVSASNIIYRFSKKNVIHFCCFRFLMDSFFGEKIIKGIYLICNSYHQNQLIELKRKPKIIERIEFNLYYYL
jgi:hypothetical protein